MIGLSRLLTITFTTAALDRSSLWQFEASSYKAAPEGPPPSVAFGSHGDHNVYQGWLMGYDAATLTQKFVWSSTYPTSGNNQGAIWQSGGGPSGDFGQRFP